VSERTRRIAVPVLLFVALYAFFALTFDFRNLTDTDLNSRQTETFVLHGTVDLTGQDLLPSEFAFHHDGHLYSEFGVGISVVSAPLYAILARTSATRGFTAGATAIAFVTGATLVLFSVLSRIVPRSLAAISALVFAVATPMWPIGTTALHEHSAVALAQAIGLAGLFGRRRWSAALAGAGFGFAAFVRPTELVVAGLAALFFLVRERRSVLPFVAGAVLPVAGILIQNRWLWDNWFTGGYANNPVGFSGSVGSGLFGLLLSWWRGLFVYTPVLAVGFAGFALALRRARGFVEGRLVLLGVISLAMIGLYSRWGEWWGGTSQFGYRFLLEVVPFLVVGGAYAVDRLPRVRPAATWLAVISAATMSVGMAPNRFAWDGVKFPSHVSDSPLGQAWIAFGHHPLGPLLRLAGIAALAALFVAGVRWMSPESASVAVNA
jgi:hypothetical protein